MRLLSWNIRWGCGCDERVDLDRVADVVRKADPDVACLQEVAAGHPGLAGSSGEDQAAELGRRFPGFSAHYAIGSDLLGDHGGGRRTFGNLMLSRLPVEQVLRHSLPWPAEPGVASMPRIALEAIVATASGPLRVTTTHLEYYSLAQRTAQMRRLRELHEEAHGHAAAPPPADVDPPFRHARRARSAVFCGDFNCEPGSAELQGLLLPFADGVPALKDAWTIAHAGAPHAPTVGLHGCPWPDRPYCCDFFFVTEDLAPRVRRLVVDAATAASDHQPLLLELDD